MAESLGALAARFEQICERILTAHGYQVRARGEMGSPDFLVEDPNRVQTAVEVKLYRSWKVEPSILRNAAAQVARYKKKHQTKGMLIATAQFDDRDKKLLTNIGIDEIWDLPELVAKASVAEPLASGLEQLLRDAEIGYSQSLRSFREDPGELLGASRPASKTRSEELVEAFQSTLPGPADSRRFESLCCESIKHLFGEHLGQLQEQQRIEQGFQYMDLIARLIPKKTSAFWVCLAQDFRCRYVVFEFKNYTDEISQNQIYTTEKYLYPAALRSVAIIIARNGADSGALRATQGALRELSKLILILTLDQLFDLLSAKDRGTEPSDIMIDHLDKLLTNIAP
jgi:hypothetical protein